MTTDKTLESISAYAGVSQRAQTLLSMGENDQVDYKSHAKGVSAEDFVAFANTVNGGAILIGVSETEDTSGRQIGKITGCKVGDKARMSLISKALSCSPPVQMHLNIENTDDLPFFRVEIPSGAQKPYCTDNGTYKIRVDGRNLSLYPNQLLAMFLEKEGSLFVERFSTATQSISEHLALRAEELGRIEELLSAKVSGLGKALSKIISSQDRLDDLDAKILQLSLQIQEAQSSGTLSWREENCYDDSAVTPTADDQ